MGNKNRCRLRIRIRNRIRIKNRIGFRSRITDFFAGCLQTSSRCDYNAHGSV